MDRAFKTIESIFVQRKAIAKHLAAPMLPEREAYLRSLLEAGWKHGAVAERASVLFYVVQYLSLPAARQVSETEINDASMTCSSATGLFAGQRRKRFKAAARSWCRFHNRHISQSQIMGVFGEALQEFTIHMERELGHLPLTVHCHSYAARRFLEWVSPLCSDIANISLSDATQYVEHRRVRGWSRRTCIGNVSSIRSFFRFLESRGLNCRGISKSLCFRASAHRDGSALCPSWKQVRRMLDWLDCSNPSHCRAKALLLLAAVYGLRRSELIRLTLDDIDWRGAVITVRRSKRGKVQQFPLQREVGEAIIRYVKEVRKPSRFRNVFLTMHAPHRPAWNIATAMRGLMAASGAFDRTWGLHALRHACATQLLKQGTSLRGIADFLGHRGLDSVSIYAHCDPRALRAVADADISEFL